MFRFSSLFFSALLATAVSAQNDANQFKNVILLIPDGCDDGVLGLARWYKNEPLFVDSMKVGSIHPYMANSLMTDSAPGGTAYSTGKITTDKFIAVGPRREDLLSTLNEDELWPEYAPIPTILEVAQALGKKTGLVATSTVTHATPGDFACHVDNRSKEVEMAKQMVYNNVDVVMGGGRDNMLPAASCFPKLDGAGIGPCTEDEPCGVCQGSCTGDETCDGDLVCHFKERTEPGSPDSLVPGCSGESTSRTNWCVDADMVEHGSAVGNRDDCDNLEAVFTDRGYELCYTQSELMSIEPTADTKVWCSFAGDAMEPDINREFFAPEQPSIAEMTQKAIDILSTGDDGFFLMVEGSQVDWAGHANDPIWMVTDFMAWDDAVKAAVEFAEQDGETLVLAMPDHNTGGLKVGGYNFDYTDRTVEFARDPLLAMTMTTDGAIKMMGVPEDEATAADLQSAVSEYWGIDLSEEQAQEILDFSANYSDTYLSSPSIPLPLSYALGRLVSEQYTIAGWTSFGHTGENVPMWVYGIDPPQGYFNNRDAGDLVAAAFGGNFLQEDGSLYVDLDTTSLSYTVDVSDVTDQHAIIEGMKFPLNVDFFYLNEDENEDEKEMLPGITVYAPMTGKLYISSLAVESVMALK